MSKNSRKDNKDSFNVSYRLKGPLNFYTYWPILADVLMLLLTIHVYHYNRRLGLLSLIYFIIFTGVSLYLIYFGRIRIYSELVTFAQEFGDLQKDIIDDMNMPFAIFSNDGHMLWSNSSFVEIIVNKKAAKRNISNVFPDITCDKFPKPDKDTEFTEVIGDNIYRVVLRRVVFDKEEPNTKLPFDRIASVGSIVIASIYDETEMAELKRNVKDENMLVGLLYIDNFDETFSANDDVTQTLSLAITNRRINAFMTSIDAIYKKFEKDKYVFVFREKYLDDIKEKNFSILDEVRTTINSNQTSCTLSIGVGTGDDSFANRYNKARAAIDLALGRGGNQAVIKNEESEEFFGGKQVKVEKTTRVKARVKAQALKEIIESKERVVVMGHQMGDLDSFGACIGIFKIAKSLGRKVYIVLGECSETVYPIRDSFVSQKYPADMIISNEQAINLVDENTALVVVDVNKADRTQCPELLEMTNSIVVIDHHRQAGNSIDNAILFYIEPYASSACEMIAEISQYVEEGDKLTVEEANALYAGIMIDTNYFTSKCGVRTFETMAFLKRNGADTVKLRKMFRENIDDYKMKASVIQTAEIYENGFAIAVSDQKDAPDPTVLGAKVANALLDLEGVKASFVLTPLNGVIFISARAIDEVNVQVLMEKLGGGGHLDVAGAQLKNSNTKEAIEKIKKIIDEYLETEKKSGKK
ncbi:MAG: DHH family phosphoesterase [Lachnospiraceae bacterium]|nr:DHH family phosphoesterase [Lachnospiraceae bacterium]